MRGAAACERLKSDSLTVAEQGPARARPCTCAINSWASYQNRPQIPPPPPPLVQAEYTLKVIHHRVKPTLQHAFEPRMLRLSDLSILCPNLLWYTTIHEITPD